MNEDPPVPPHGSLSRSELAAEISTRLVKLIAEYTGRGPTKARSYIHSDLVVCVLHDTLTKGERSLVRHGESAAVLTQRDTYQRLMEQDASAMVEQLTGRRVAAFLGANHVDPEIAVAVFVLESPDG
jgi:uncharacterized protein YbcI